MEKNEIITTLAKKGFLLDRESIDFFIKIDNINLIEEVLNRVVTLTKVRIISKKGLIANFREIKPFFMELDPEKLIQVKEFFGEAFDYTGKEVSVMKKLEITPGEYCNSGIKIITSNIIPYRRIEVKDFVTHFKNRYNLFKDILHERKELENLISINKIGNNRNFSIIGLVSKKRVTKNKNIVLEVEDLTGKMSILVSQDKETVFKKGQEIVLDDVIGLRCSGGSGKDFFYANDIVFADSFLTEKRRSDTEGYALFISDIHIGSKLFLEQNFLKFIKWLNCEGVDEVTAEKIRKIKYLFVVGDNVDGVGIYPGQEPLLTIKDMKEQYKKLAEYFDMIPKNIKIIMCPGQHDSVRVPEPQPAVDEEFAKELCEMKNVFLVCNPSYVEMECGDKKRGFRVLMYHGASMIDWRDAIDELRLSNANMNPSKIVKYMLRHRHLSPTHSANVYVPGEKEDSMAIKEVPDIILTGDLHKTDVDIYNNVLIICGSCWQSMTPFEEKVGNHPDPCKVPMLNLKTREIKILDFT